MVQAGKESENLGELVVTLEGGRLTVASYRLYPIDDTIVGDKVIAAEIEKFKKSVTGAVFASRGYEVDQPLAVAPRDLPNTFADIPPFLEVIENFGGSSQAALAAITRVLAVPEPGGASLCCILGAIICQLGRRFVRTRGQPR